MTEAKEEGDWASGERERADLGEGKQMSEGGTSREESTIDGLVQGSYVQSDQSVSVGAEGAGAGAVVAVHLHLRDADREQ
eukprot:282237-Rhodomonas_salina.1